MRLAMTSVVTTGNRMDTLRHFGAAHIVGELAATTVRRKPDLPAGMPDLAQKAVRGPKRMHPLQVLALKALKELQRCHPV
jgi:hypothetical protein